MDKHLKNRGTRGQDNDEEESSVESDCSSGHWSGTRAIGIKEKGNILQVEDISATEGTGELSVSDPYGKEGFLQILQEPAVLCKCIARILICYPKD